MTPATAITVQIPRWHSADETLRERHARTAAAWKTSASAAGLTIEAEDYDDEDPLGDAARVRVAGRWYVLRGEIIDDDLLSVRAHLALDEWIVEETASIREEILAFLGDAHLAYDLDGMVAAYSRALDSGHPVDLALLATQYELPEEPDR